MDIASQHVAAGLVALAGAVDKLRSFGYSLYLETKARSWTQPRGLTFCGKGYASSMVAVTIGFAIHRDSAGEKSIVFSILLAWDAAHWSIQCFVEDEDVSHDQITEGLWESPEYRGVTLDKMLKCLDQAIGMLISSAKEARVAAMLASVGPSQ
jgi:hypothetical protein